MENEYLKYNLFDFMVFEKIILTKPQKKINILHDEACFFYVISGENRTHTAIEKIDVKKGEFVVLKCGTHISRMSLNSNFTYFEAIAVHFHPEVLKRVYSNELPSFLKKSSQNENRTHVKIKSTDLIDKFIQSFVFYFEHPELINEELLVLKLKELILLLLHTSDSLTIHGILSSLFSPSNYSLKQVVEAHLYSENSITDLANLCNMSLSTFKREFNKLFGSSPANYIRKRKLQRAKDLLVISEERISEIAFECGFNNVAHFSKLFHTEFNQSPKDFRLNQMNNKLA